MGDNHREVMETDKLTLALKAIEISGQGKGKTPEEIIDWADEICKAKFKTERVQSVREFEPSEEDIDEIYRAYPTKDIHNKKTTLEKNMQRKKHHPNQLNHGIG